MLFTLAFIKSTFQAKWKLGELITTQVTSNCFIIRVLQHQEPPEYLLKAPEWRQQVEYNEQCYKRGHKTTGLVKMESPENCVAVITDCWCCLSWLWTKVTAFSKLYFFSQLKWNQSDTNIYDNQSHCLLLLPYFCCSFQVSQTNSTRELNSKALNCFQIRLPKLEMNLYL